MPKSPKNWCSFTEQAEKLIEKDLIVNDKDELIAYLTSHNYYYVTGYLYQYLDSTTNKYTDLDAKSNKLTFYKIRDIINADCFLRAIINYQIDIIERDIKTKVAYYIGEIYGPMGYLNNPQFTGRKEFNRFKKLLKTYKNQNRNQEFIKHHDLEYGGNLPIWVAIEIMPLGSVEKLFSFLDVQTKRKLVKCYAFNDLDKFESWLTCLVKFRNLVAHNNRLYRFDIKMTPKKSKIYPTLTGKIFDYLVVLRELYPNESVSIWNAFFLNALSNFEVQKPDIKLSEYGFPANWKEILEI